VRFSDLFTDLSYIAGAPSLTTLGWILLLPPAFLNLVGVVIMLRGYRQAQNTLTEIRAATQLTGTPTSQGKVTQAQIISDDNSSEPRSPE
jgi:hypothetical protein